MTQCSIRVITNGYVLVYMDGNDMIELCFDSRKELKSWLEENLSVPAWEVTE